MDRSDEFVKRVEGLLDEFDDLGGPAIAKILLTVALALVDGFCFGHTKRRATEDEFALIARDAYRHARELVPLVKPMEPGQN